MSLFNTRTVLGITVAVTISLLTGCSGQKSTTAASLDDDVDALLGFEAQKARQKKVSSRVQKAAYHKPNTSYSNKYTLSKDFETWNKIFRGFRLGNHNNNPRVQRFIREYSSNPKRLNILSARSAVYLHMVASEVERRGMPMEVALLPFVESGFNANVFSKAGAAGLWQFIPSTGRNYGLTQTRNYDERLDTFAATGAALNYLNKLKRDFNGDWLLALAAYNAGEGRVSRAVTRQKLAGKPVSFWHLDLPRETMEYVPRLLAYKELMSNAPRYGITLPAVPNSVRLTQMRINKPVDLRQAATKAGLPANTLTKLNPAYLRGITTPHISNRIILPSNQAKHLAQIIQRMPASSPPKSRSYVVAQRGSSKKVSKKSAKKRTITHTVKPGENLYRIALKHGTSVKRIMSLNGKRSISVRVGERLKVATNHGNKHYS